DRPRLRLLDGHDGLRPVRAGRLGPDRVVIKGQLDAANVDPVPAAEPPAAGQPLAVHQGPVATAPVLDKVLVPGALALGVMATDPPDVLENVRHVAGRVSAEKAPVGQREHPLTVVRPACPHQYRHGPRSPRRPGDRSPFVHLLWLRAILDPTATLRQGN